MCINNINSNVHAPWQLRDTYFNDLENSAHYTAFFASVTGTARLLELDFAAA